MKKRFLAFVLSMIILAEVILPGNTLAVDAEEVSCTHHTEHTAECGYVEAVEGHECAHVCDENCYKKTLDCLHEAGQHDETCGYVPATAETPEISCSHVCDEGCEVQTAECVHTEHTAECGYVEPVEGKACEYVCAECNQVSKDSTDEVGELTETAVTENVNQSTENVNSSETEQYVEKVNPNEIEQHADNSSEYEEPEVDPYQYAPGFGWEIPGEEEAVQLTTRELYRAMFAANSLREIFDLINENVDSYLGLNAQQVYDLEAYIESIYAGYETATESEEEAYIQLMDDIMFSKTELGIAECTCNNLEAHTSECPLYVSYTVRQHIRAVTYEETSNDGSVHFSKDLVEDGSQNLAIQIDAWTEGKIVTIPTEIVMVVDQSGSMYQAVDGAESYMSYEELCKNGNTDGGKHAGYYVVVAENIRYNEEKPYKWPATEGEVGHGDLDWNKAYDGATKYAVALVRYNEDTKTWQRSHQVKTTTAQYESLDVNPTYRAFYEASDLKWSNIDPTSDSDCYGRSTAKYFKSVYGATIDAYYTLLDQVKTIPNCSIAVAGFSSPAAYGERWTGLMPEDTGFEAKGGSNYGGTGVFINGDFKHKSKLTEQDYKDALVPVDSQTNIDLISRAISNIVSNYNETCTEDGFLLANEIFKNSDQPNANRVVVLFTDGAPTTVSSMLPPDDENRVPRPEDYKDYAIKAAYETKNTYNAKVYAFGNKSINEDFRKDLEYQSSNYPDAQISGGTYDQKGTEYFGIASSSEDIAKAFLAIGEKIYNESLALNKNSEIRDTVTPYFDIGGFYNGGNIIVQQIPCSGIDEYGNAIFDEASAVILYDTTDTEPEKVTLTLNLNREYSQEITNSDGTKQTVTRTGDQVVVSGYDYVANTVYKEEATGAKLRLIIPIKPNEQFLGGNYAMTNSADSGIFPDSDADTPVGGEDGYFPPPHEDVVVKNDQAMEGTIDARAGSLFLESVSYKDILNAVRLTIEGFDESLEMGQENYGLDEWQLDYANIEVKFFDTLVNGNGDLVDENENVLTDPQEAVKNPAKPINGPTAEKPEGDSIEVRRNRAVYVEVTIWPKFNSDGSEATKPLEPTATGVVVLEVYYPTFVFKDVSLYYGQPLIQATEVWGEKMEATKYLKWYTNAEFMELENPQSDSSADGYTDLNVPSSYGTDGSVPVTEVPKVYFVVNPIDTMVPPAAKSGSVDTSFYEKYGNYMLKQSIGLNVQVFFQNEGDTWEYDPNNTLEESKMRNAFFLHATGEGQMDVSPHTSGSQKLLQEYWKEEFYIQPKTCTMTIKKTGGIPGETYVFDISRGLINEYSKYEKDDQGNPKLIQSATDPTYYTSVSITVDEHGEGSVTIYELPVGIYEITENREWSWRYKESTPVITWGYGESTTNSVEGEVATVTLNPNDAEDTATVSFVNHDPVKSWLSGMSEVVQNIFGIAGKKEESTEGTE